MSEPSSDTEGGTIEPVRDESPPRLRREQPLAIRCAHWLNVPLLTLMAASGLQILDAYPNFGPRGALYSWFPLQEADLPSWLRFGGWLAGARHWHFALAWFLVLNGALYLAYVFASGEWRRRLFLPRRDTRNALRMFAYYSLLTRTPPPADFYNGLQRLAYTSAIVIGIAMVLSGLAIYKPVQLHWLAALFGGYDGARVVHFTGLCLLVAFVVSHLVLVASHPREIVKMINGGARAAIDKPS
ncbi:MAG TPA: cytochrome b/b6 domain-containing protein [Candidatus Binataceae bacterium]|nr:cytochrome b/b6 domain-containing protein [Candidatus Binataceae bacterium]